MSAPGKVERGFAIGFLLLSTGAFMNLFLAHHKLALESSAGLPFMQVVWSVLYFCVLFFLIGELRGFSRLLLRGWPFLLLLAVTLLSIIWSDVRGLTARRSVALVATTLAGFYLAIRYPFKEQLRLLVVLSKLCVVFSLAFGLLHLGTAVDSLNGPKYGIFIQRNSTGILGFFREILPALIGCCKWNDPWYGIFTQRNILGMIMALSTVVLLLWSRLEPEEKWSAYFWAGLCFLLIFLSGSLTGYLSLCATLAVGYLLRKIRLNPLRARRILAATAVMVGIGLYFTASHTESVASFFDRDVTLTGRTTIWGASLVLGMDHPWFGRGFNAFWLGDQGPSGEIRNLAGWDVPSAHNGYLEIWLDLGLCGLAVFFLGFLRHFGKSLRYFLSTDEGEGSWPVLYLAFLALINLSQSALVSPNYYFWILYVAVSARVCMSKPELPSEAGA